MRNNMTDLTSSRFSNKAENTSEDGQNVERAVESLSGGIADKDGHATSKVHDDEASCRAEAGEKGARPTRSNVRAASESASFATEAGHWYLQDGTPYYTVPNKSKPGSTRPVTITDARKAGAVPSVTAITGLIKGEGLIQYIRRQVFEATLLCPYPFKDETPEQHMARALAMAEQHKEKAAERGTSLHGEIEHYLLGEEVHPRWWQHIEKLVATMKQLGIDLRAGQRDGRAEKSFAHPLGYGGKCDYYQFDEPTVLDFKSKDSIEPNKKYAFDEHAMQIASYAMGLGLSLRVVRGINVFIGEQDQRILVHEWPEADLQSAWEQFKHLLAVWQIRKKYCPTFGAEEREQ